MLESLKKQNGSVQHGVRDTHSVPPSRCVSVSFRNALVLATGVCAASGCAPKEQARLPTQETAASVQAPQRKCGKEVVDGVFEALKPESRKISAAAHADESDKIDVDYAGKLDKAGVIVDIVVIAKAISTSPVPLLEFCKIPGLLQREELPSIMYKRVPGEHDCVFEGGAFIDPKIKICQSASKADEMAVRQALNIILEKKDELKAMVGGQDRSDVSVSVLLEANSRKYSFRSFTVEKGCEDKKEVVGLKPFDIELETLSPSASGCAFKITGIVP